LRTRKADYILFVADDEQIAPWLLGAIRAAHQAAAATFIVITLSDLRAASLGEQSRRAPANLTTPESGMARDTDGLFDDQITVTMCSVMMRTDSCKRAADSRSICRIPRCCRLGAAAAPRQVRVRQ